MLSRSERAAAVRELQHSRPGKPYSLRHARRLYAADGQERRDPWCPRTEPSGDLPGALRAYSAGRLALNKAAELAGLTRSTFFRRAKEAAEKDGDAMDDSPP